MNASGDGIAVGGPPPPPTPPVANDAPLSAELCGLIQKQGIFYSDRYFDEQDRAKKGAYLVKFRNAESLFNDGGCKTTLGQNVMGGKVGV